MPAIKLVLSLKGLQECVTWCGVAGVTATPQPLSSEVDTASVESPVSYSGSHLQGDPGMAWAPGVGKEKDQENEGRGRRGGGRGGKRR